MREFENKTVVASGAASGMGYLLCQEYAREGGNAVLCDINAEALAAAVDRINEIRAGAAIGVVCDVRDYQQICHVRDEAMRVFGSIDLVVPCAGGAELRVLKIGGDLEFPDVPIEVYDWSLDVNLRAQLYFDHAMLAPMREQRSGLIVHIGSVTGEEGSDNNEGYAAAKSGAMYGLTRSIAQYGSQYGIRCVCVSPGPVLTREAMSKMRTLLNRAAEPQEVVDFILYLASEKGSFFNGVNLFVDGGRTALPRKGYRS
jgi:3-oxoacyl-[acyl-carrier protein] reductase